MITLLKMKEDLFDALQDHFYDANDLVLDHAYCIDEDVLNSYNEEDADYCDYEKYQLKEIKARFDKIRPDRVYQGKSVCPHCDSTSVEFQYPVFTKNKYIAIYQCEHCGTIYEDIYNYSKEQSKITQKGDWLE
jgi:transposase-like protein